MVHADSAFGFVRGDREKLDSVLRSSTVPAGLAQRAGIVLLASQGVSNSEIARRCGVSRPTVITWRGRYAERGLAGLADEERSGRSRKLDHSAIVTATLRPPPAKLGVTHCSSRLLAGQLGISFSAVAKAWREYGVQPWRAETFKYSADPDLVAKIHDVVGLYLSPPDKAIVLSIDEKSQIQALGRTQPMLPGSVEKRTHDYVRHGTTTQFAALEVATGTVTTACKPRRRGTEYLAFLKQVAPAYPDQQLHLICDNYATHKAPEVKVAGRKTAHPSALHSDLGVMAQPGRSLVRAIQRQAISRGTFTSVGDLTAKICAVVTGWNNRATPFAWTKTPQEILDKATRKTTSNTNH
jgi:transposase